MFTAGRWAAAFTGAAGDDAEAAFVFFKGAARQARKIPGAIFGFSASKRFESLIRRATAETAGMDGPGEIALRFLILLIRKDGLRHLEEVIRAIEAALDRKNGVVAALVESARPLEEDYQEALKERIKTRTGAAEVKLHVRLVPELLGGCRLRIGSDCFDASLRSQLVKLAAALGESAHGGRIIDG
ncbi:MAG: ATP synthase F1 subunit delta [Treponema sp.]|jgi:ATP synthase F1 delta subunit|nr:ATP synthase F1 subunit delta [Treponema sp.]